MFSLGQVVMHPTAGVCKIESTEKKFFSRTQCQEYFVLKPVFSSNTTLFLPVDSNKVGVRELLSTDDINRNLDSVDFSETLWVDNDNARYDNFLEVMKSKNNPKIIQMIIEIKNVEISRIANGKNLRVSDAKILKEAEKIIYEEIAYVLNLELDKAKTLVLEKFGITVE